jgi:integrase
MAHRALARRCVRGHVADLDHDQAARLADLRRVEDVDDGVGAGDPLCRCRLQSLTPAVIRAAICRWRDDGVSVPKVSARWLLLRGAVSWAVAEGLLRVNPLAGMRGPPRPQPRRRHSLDEVHRLLAAAGEAVASAQDALMHRPGSAARAQRLFAAEQSLLLVRLAADSGARRGELAVLRLSDLDGRVLTIERSLSSGVLGPTKSRRTRRVALGSGTADMIRRHFQAWAARVEPEQDWLFSLSPWRSAYLTADALSRRLTRVGPASGAGHAALHRLRHGVATYLVDQGRLLKAQARLGHRDPATTLRHYSHAIPLDDNDVADELDRLLNGLTQRSDHSE